MMFIKLPELKHAPEGPDQSAEDYLSRLAQSVLSKDKPRASSAAVPRVNPMQTPVPRDLPQSGRPPGGSGVHPTPRAAAPAEPRKAEASPVQREWIRKVDFYDENGAFIPGTILVFEDGTIGVFKESYASKDYDLVYQLAETGRAVPQGMPLYTYTVEPIGRLSEAVLAQLVATSKWDRDMIVFHLLKYKDRVHVPQITAASSDHNQSLGSSEAVSSWAVPKLDASQLRGPSGQHEVPSAPSAQPEKPTLTRGRRLTIEFGPSRNWDAVYWGKDELGHVVAHNTHEKWALMHLDLSRFKDCTQFGEIVSPEVMRKMEQDFTSQ